MQLFKRSTALVVAVALLGLGFAPPAAPATRPVKIFRADDFLRHIDDDARPRLEVSILTLKGADGFTVDLVSAVHVADASYFQDLNNRFIGYDAVLYEMVKPRGAPVPERGHRSGSAVSGVQRGLKAVLGLSFQLDEVDYTKANFVHADMDVDEFLARQEARGESLFNLMMKAYLSQLAGTPPATRPGSKPFKYKPINFGGTPAERQLALKTLFAGMFGELEQQSLGLDDEDGSVILTERNDAALAVVREQRKAGKKRIAVFYGAAHMPDMATVLVKQDGLKRGNTEWLTAWDLTPPTPETLPTTRP